MFVLSNLLVYSLEVGIFLTVTYIGWRIFLYNTTFHSFNRIVILSSIFISLLLPCIIHIIPAPPSDPGLQIGDVSNAVIVSSDIPANETNNIFITYWREILISFYALGMVCAVLWILINHMRLISIIHKSHNLYKKHIHIKVSEEVDGPFNWFGMTILSPHDCDENLKRVIQHEQLHIKRWHWLDLLLLQIIIVIEWYNPVIWIILRRLKAIHEYEVDAAIPSDEQYEYSRMLLQKISDVHNYGITDGLNSNLKNRLKMIHKKKNSPSRRCAAFLILPMVALAAYGVSRPRTENVLNSIKVVSTSPQNVASQKKQGINQFAYNKNTATDTCSVDTDTIAITGAGTIGIIKMPDNPDGLSDKNRSAHPVVFVDGVRYSKDINTIDKSIIESITVRKDNPEYPGGEIYIETKNNNSNRIVASANQSSDTVTVVGVKTIKKNEKPDKIVISDGKNRWSNPAVFVDGVRYTQDIETIDSSIIESISVLKYDPEYPDGVIYIITKNNESGRNKITTKNGDPLKIQHISSIKKAQFSGGQEALEKWLINHMKYPAEAVDGKIQGRVIVQAKIGYDGKVTDAIILSSTADRSLNNEALRLVKMMPAWEPATHKGKAVNSQVNIPITFKLPRK